MIGSGLHGLIRTKCCVKRKGSPRKSVSVRCKKEKSIMRKISLIIIHCSAVRPDQMSSAAQIDSWHRKDNHWKLGSGLDIRGQPADTRTPEQKAALRWLLTMLHKAYPRALIVGHHDLNPAKDCPCIPDVANEYKDLQPE